MREKKYEVIRCPRCDYEYLPSEIFIPKSFFGTQKYVERDFSGRVLDYIGEPMDLTETYRCDNCDVLFNIATKISFSTSLDKIENIDEDYSSGLGETELFV